MDFGKIGNKALEGRESSIQVDIGKAGSNALNKLQGRSPIQVDIGKAGSDALKRLQEKSLLKGVSPSIASEVSTSSVADNIIETAPSASLPTEVSSAGNSVAQIIHTPVITTKDKYSLLAAVFSGNSSNVEDHVQCLQAHGVVPVQTFQSVEQVADQTQSSLEQFQGLLNKRKVEDPLILKRNPIEETSQLQPICIKQESECTWNPFRQWIGANVIKGKEKSHVLSSLANNLDPSSVESTVSVPMQAERSSSTLTVDTVAAGQAAMERIPTELSRSLEAESSSVLPAFTPSLATNLDSSSVESANSVAIQAERSPPTLTVDTVAAGQAAMERISTEPSGSLEAESSSVLPAFTTCDVKESSAAKSIKRNWSPFPSEESRIRIRAISSSPEFNIEICPVNQMGSLTFSNTEQLNVASNPTNNWNFFSWFLKKETRIGTESSLAAPAEGSSVLPAVTPSVATNLEPSIVESTASVPMQAERSTSSPEVSVVICPPNPMTNLSFSNTQQDRHAMLMAENKPFSEVFLPEWLLNSWNKISSFSHSYSSQVDVKESNIGTASSSAKASVSLPAVPAVSDSIVDSALPAFTIEVCPVNQMGNLTFPNTEQDKLAVLIAQQNRTIESSMGTASNSAEQAEMSGEKAKNPANNWNIFSWFFKEETVIGTESSLAAPAEGSSVLPAVTPSVATDLEPSSVESVANVPIQAERSAPTLTVDTAAAGQGALTRIQTEVSGAIEAERSVLPAFTIEVCPVNQMGNLTFPNTEQDKLAVLIAQQNRTIESSMGTASSSAEQAEMSGEKAKNPANNWNIFSWFFKEETVIGTGSSLAAPAEGSSVLPAVTTSVATDLEPSSVESTASVAMQAERSTSSPEVSVVIYPPNPMTNLSFSNTQQDRHAMLMAQNKPFSEVFLPEWLLNSWNKISSFSHSYSSQVDVKESNIGTAASSAKASVSVPAEDSSVLPAVTPSLATNLDPGSLESTASVAMQAEKSAPILKVDTAAAGRVALARLLTESSVSVAAERSSVLPAVTPSLATNLDSGSVESAANVATQAERSAPTLKVDTAAVGGAVVERIETKPSISIKEEKSSMLPEIKTSVATNVVPGSVGSTPSVPMQAERSASTLTVDTAAAGKAALARIVTESSVSVPAEGSSVLPAVKPSLATNLDPGSVESTASGAIQAERSSSRLTVDIAAADRAALPRIVTEVSGSVPLESSSVLPAATPSLPTNVVSASVGDTLLPVFTIEVCPVNQMGNLTFPNTEQDQPAVLIAQQNMNIQSTIGIASSSAEQAERSAPILKVDTAAAGRAALTRIQTEVSGAMEAERSAPTFKIDTAAPGQAALNRIVMDPSGSYDKRTYSMEDLSFNKKNIVANNDATISSAAPLNDDQQDVMDKIFEGVKSGFNKASDTLKQAYEQLPEMNAKHAVIAAVGVGALVAVYKLWNRNTAKKSKKVRQMIPPNSKLAGRIRTQRKATRAIGKALTETEALAIRKQQYLQKLTNTLRKNPQLRLELMRSLL